MPMEPTAAISVQFTSLSGYMATAIAKLTAISGQLETSNTYLASISGQYTALKTYTSGAWKELVD